MNKEKNGCVQTILQIRQLSRFLDKYSKYLNNNYNITLPQLLCLYEISDNEEMNLSQLTKGVNLNNSAVTGIIDRLESKGFVKRIKKGTDRRTIYLELTEAGQEYVLLLFKILESDCFFDNEKLNVEQIRDINIALDKIIKSFVPEVKEIELT
ncbi:MAG: MarR family transcriptional regulator [Denitrovibrio sp.]|nr:MAG: MarR family transcriptional regulator [Denitrovibrio sp.]